MKFQIALTAFAALALAQDSAPTTQTTVAPAPMPTPELSPEAKCIVDNKCAPDNLSCVAKCMNVPNPTADMVNKTNSCVASCDQSNTQKYAMCTEECIKGNFSQHPNAENVNTPQKDGSGNDHKGNSTTTSKVGSNGYQLVPVLASVTGLSVLLLSL